MVPKLLTRRNLILLSLSVIIPLGLLSKAYSGVGQAWVRDYSGDVLYEAFWCLVVLWFIREGKDAIALRKLTSKIALWVFIVTCAIEVSQLWFYLVPRAIRSSFIWLMVLRTGFSALRFRFAAWLLANICNWSEKSFQLKRNRPI